MKEDLISGLLCIVCKTIMLVVLIKLLLGSFIYFDENCAEKQTL